MLTELACVGLGLSVGGYAYAANWPTSQVFGRTLLAGSDPNEIALTYDDGPNDPYTPRLLEILAQYEVRATFFLIGRFVRQRPEIARAIRAAGHMVGNHTMHHPVLLWQSPRVVREELAACSQAIEDAIGERVAFFRPPHGARRPDILRTARELGLTPVMWNAAGNDWKGLSPAEIAGHVNGGLRKNLRARSGSNVLLHDGGQAALGIDRAATLAATQLLLDEFKAHGRTLVTVEKWAQVFAV